MSAPPSFSTLPDAVYRGIAEYFAISITTKVDFHTYRTLQRCCNATFARQIRSVMENHLQRTEAALGLYEVLSLRYPLKHPCIAHNPIYLNALTFPDLCELQYHLGWICRQREHYLSFGKILLAFVDSERYQPQQEITDFPGSWLQVKRQSHMYQTDETKTVLHEDVEWNNGSGVVKDDYAMVDLWTPNFMIVQRDKRDCVEYGY